MTAAASPAGLRDPASPHLSPMGALARLLDSRWLPLLLAAVAMMPMAFIQTPPLVDAAGHLARYIVQVDAGASPVLAQWYSFQWGLVANLGCDLLAQALVPLLGPEPALRTIIALILGVQVCGILMLSRAAHGRISPTAYFALPFVYAFPFQFGFLNFWLGSGAALIALSVWITMGRSGQIRRRAVLFVPIGVALWLCHLVGLGIFLVGAFAENATRRHAAGDAAWRVVLFAGLELWPLLLGPAAGFLFARHAAVEPFSYHLTNDKLIWPIQVLRDKWRNWDIGSMLGLIGVIYWFWRSPAFARDAGLALFAGLMLVIYTLIPDMIFEAQYADMRLVPMVFILFLLAPVPTPNAGKALWGWVAIAGLVFAGARWTGNVMAMADHGAQFARTVSVLDAVPRGTNLVTLAPHKCAASPVWDRDRRDHISGYALIRRQSFDSRQWQEAAGQLLTVHNPAAAPFDREQHSMLYDVPCEGWPGVAESVRGLNPAIRHVWIIGMPADFAVPGWRTLSAAGDSVVLQRVAGQHAVAVPK